MTVRDIDRGMSRLLEQLDAVDGVRITVGVHEDDGSAHHRGSGSASTVADVAAATELGTVDEAPRSFVRAAVDERPALGRELADAGARVLQGADLREAFGAVASSLADDMKARAPSATGQLRDAIAGRVEVG